MFFRKPALPKSVEQWFRDPVAVSRLREIIADPVFQTACATLSVAAQPGHGATRSLCPEKRASSFDWLAGYHDFLRDLEKLTRIPDRTADQLEEWKHIDKNL